MMTTDFGRRATGTSATIFATHARQNGNCEAINSFQLVVTDFLPDHRTEYRYSLRELANLCDHLQLKPVLLYSFSRKGFRLSLTVLRVAS